MSVVEINKFQTSSTLSVSDLVNGARKKKYNLIRVKRYKCRKVQLKVQIFKGNENGILSTRPSANFMRSSLIKKKAKFLLLLSVIWQTVEIRGGKEGLGTNEGEMCPIREALHGVGVRTCCISRSRKLKSVLLSNHRGKQTDG